MVSDVGCVCRLNDCISREDAVCADDANDFQFKFKGRGLSAEYRSTWSVSRERFLTELCYVRWQTERPDPRHGCCGYDVTSGLERRWCYVPGERFGHLAGESSPRFKLELDDAKDRKDRGKVRRDVLLRSRLDS